MNYKYLYQYKKFALHVPKKKIALQIVCWKE